jgi:hypothetical protein
MLLENLATSSVANSIAIKITSDSSTILFHPTKGSGENFLQFGPLEPSMPILRHEISRSTGDSKSRRDFLIPR